MKVIIEVDPMCCDCFADRIEGVARAVRQGCTSGELWDLQLDNGSEYATYTSAKRCPCTADAVEV